MLHMHERAGIDPHASGLGGLSPGRALENFVRPPLATQNLAF